MNEQLGEEFQAAFWGAKRALTEASDAAFQRHGVREGQQWILRLLWDTDRLTPGDIARKLELSTPTVTKAATRMEAAGLIIRRADDRDARLVRLHLTERGRELREAVVAEMSGLATRALAQLPMQDVETLIHGLQAIRRNLTS